MRIPLRMLSDGGQVIYAARPSGWLLVRSLSIVATAIFAVLIGVHFLPAHGIFAVIRYLVLAQIFKIVLLGGIFPLIRWVRIRYILTSSKIILCHGLFRQLTKEMLHEQIAEVWYTRNRLQRMVGSGTVTFDAGGEMGRIVFKSAGNFHRLQTIMGDCPATYKSGRLSGA